MKTVILTLLLVVVYIVGYYCGYTVARNWTHSDIYSDAIGSERALSHRKEAARLREAADQLDIAGDDMRRRSEEHERVANAISAAEAAERKLEE